MWGKYLRVLCGEEANYIRAFISMYESKFINVQSGMLHQNKQFYQTLNRKYIFICRYY